MAWDVDKRLHGVELPEGYRNFLLTLSDGGTGPSFYGLVKLAFPFTKRWVSDGAEHADPLRTLGCDEVSAATFPLTIQLLGFARFAYSRLIR